MDSAKYSEMLSFSSLIDSIYRGATNPDEWPKIIQDIAVWMEAPKICLFTPMLVPSEGGFLFPQGLSQSFLSFGRHVTSRMIYGLKVQLHGALSCREISVWARSLYRMLNS